MLILEGQCSVTGVTGSKEIMRQCEGRKFYHPCDYIPPNIS